MPTYPISTVMQSVSKAHSEMSRHIRGAESMIDGAGRSLTDNPAILENMLTGGRLEAARQRHRAALETGDPRQTQIAAAKVEQVTAQLEQSPAARTAMMKTVAESRKIGADADYRRELMEGARAEISVVYDSLNHLKASGVSSIQIPGDIKDMRISELIETVGPVVSEQVAALRAEEGPKQPGNIIDVEAVEVEPPSWAKT